MNKGASSYFINSKLEITCQCSASTGVIDKRLPF